MKNFKKQFLSIVLAVAFVFAIAVIGISAGASQSAWYAKAVTYLDSIGITNIGAAGEEELARDEFVTWVSKIESHQVLESAWAQHEYVATTTFDDVEESTHKGAIGYAVNSGFIEGYGDRTFKPTQTIILGEAAVVLVRLMRYKAYLFTEGEDWGYNAMQTAQYWFNAFDATFLAKTGTYDPAYKLSKGEGAYLLYCIVNGEAWDDGDLTEAEALDLRLTSTGVDLGYAFAKNMTATVKADYVVANVPFAGYGNTQNWRRYDTNISGATYSSIFNQLYGTNGLLDTTGVVTLQNISNGAYMTMDASTFASVVKTAAGVDNKIDALNYAEQGSVVRFTTTKDQKAIFEEDAELVTGNEFTGVALVDSLVVDSYIGMNAIAVSAYRNGTNTLGWKTYTTAVAAANAPQTRLTTKAATWANVVKKSDGTVKSADLVVGDQTYTVVTAYSGKAGEIKVYTVEGIGATGKTIVSTVGWAGDKVYAGGVFSATEKAILDLHGDYAQYFTGNTVKTTFELEENIPSFVSYELYVEGGAYVTNPSFLLTSEFVVDGRLDQNFLDTTAPLTVGDAYELILAPANGESNVVFSDLDADGLYDVAFITESTRALYYGTVNASVNPASNGYLGGSEANTKEVYDSFGNFIMSAVGLKGHNIGGLVVDKTVAYGGAEGSGTDGWNLTGTSGKVQLVVCGSNERLRTGASETHGYGVSNAYPYKTVDIASLTVGYIENVAAATKVVDGVKCYVAEVLVSTDDGTERRVVYIPVTPADEIDFNVTLDGVTSTVTFQAGKSLLSFVSDHSNGDEIGTVQSGSWMAGHTVKYAAYGNSVAWCMIETAVSGAVKGYVTSVSKLDAGDNTYTVGVAATGSTSLSLSSTTVPFADSYAFLKENLILDSSMDSILIGFGIDALFNNDIPVQAYRFTEAGNAFLVANNANMSKLFHGLGAYGAQLTGLTYASGHADGTQPYFDQTTWVYAPTSTIRRFAAGTYLTVQDVEILAYDQYKGLQDVTALVTDANFADMGTLYVEEDGDFVEVDPTVGYDADATYYAYFFELEDLTSGDLFGYFSDTNANIDWTKIGVKFTDSKTSGKIGESLVSAKVTGSSTAVWNYTAEAYTTVHSLLVDRIFYNTANAVADGKVTSEDLVYISLSKSPNSSYYTIEGLDAAAYTTTNTGWTEATMFGTYHASYPRFIGTLVASKSYDGINVGRGGWRADTYFGYVQQLYTTGAGDTTMWADGDEAIKVLGGTFKNYYVLGYSKTSANSTPVMDTAGTTQIGISDTFNMIVGCNPYYYRTVGADGKLTYTLKFEVVKSLEGVIGYKYFEIDKSKTDLIKVWEGEDTTKQRKDDGQSYNDTSKYYIDENTYVWYILNAAVYDQTKFTTKDYKYVTDNANLVDEFFDLTAAEVGTQFNITAPTEKDLVTITASEYTKDEEGYAPLLYHVNLKVDMGEDDVKSFQMLYNTPIVVINPVSGKKGETNFDIKVVTAKQLVDNNSSIFASSFQYAGSATTCTMLSVIGKVVGKLGDGEATPVDPGTQPDPVKDDSVSKGAKVVYLNASAGAIAEAVQTDNYWVIRSTASAIDIATGEEVGNISYKYGTYTSHEVIVNGQAGLAAGGYFVVSADNMIVSKIDEYTADKYGTNEVYAKVLAGEITAADAAGNTTATMNGKTGVDISGFKFVFLYHDLDGNNFGQGGSSTKVQITSEAAIVASYSTYSTIVNTGTESGTYTQEDIDDAQAHIDEVRAAAVAKYFDGTFWNVQNSPVAMYIATQIISYQKTSASLKFNYLKMDGTYYVFVNSFLPQ